MAAVTCSVFSKTHHPSLPEDSLPELQKIINEALDVSPRMMIRRADAAATLANLDGAKSSRWPRVGGWASYYRVEDDRNDPLGSRPGTTLNYRVSIDQPAYHWGNISRNIRNAEIRSLIDSNQTRLAYLNLARDVRLQYLNLIRARRGIDRAELGLKINEAGLRRALQQREQDQGSEAEVIAARLMQQRGQLAAAEAEDWFLRESRVLARLVGSEPLAADDVPDWFSVPDFVDDAPIVISLMASFLAAGDPENSEIINAQRELEIAQNNHKNTKTALRPFFDVTAGISQQDQDFSLSANDYNFRQLFAGVSVRWTLWDSFATKARVRSSLANLRAAEVRLQETQHRLIDNADDLGRLIKRDAMRISIVESELESARGHLDYTLDLRERGEASESDVLNSEYALQQKIEEALFVRTSYWNRISDLLVMIEMDPILAQVPNTAE